MKNQHLAECYELISIVPAVYLSTINEMGMPETRAMLNLHNPSQFPDLKEFLWCYEVNLEILFTTNTSSEKVRQVLYNPNVSLFFCKPEAWHGLTLCGKMEIVSDMAIKGRLWQANWFIYYPDGPESEDYCVMLFKPKYAKSYNKFERFRIEF